MLKFGRLSVGALMGVAILAMASMLLTYAATGLIEAHRQAGQAGQAVTLAQASRSLLKTLLPLRLERGSSRALGG
jgi:hypothetical protein